MKISVSCLAHCNETGTPALAMQATPAPEDAAKYADTRVKIGHQNIVFELEHADVFYTAHPDLIGLVCLLAYGPFTSEVMELNFAVSEDFARVVQDNLRLRITPTSALIRPRKVGADYIDSVSFSGGVDSCVALHLMPENTLAVFQHRLRPEGEPVGLYRDGGALASCAAVAASGRRVRKFITSLEYARSPVGFPNDWANSTTIILHADHFKVRSIAYGMIMEAAYSTGQTQFRDLEKKSIYRAWKPVFEATGLSICLPTAGLSEVITSRIALEHLMHWLPSSCVRVVDAKPCGRCFKCFRKRITDCGILHEHMPQAYLDMPLVHRGVADHVCTQPMHLENVMAYALARMPDDETHPVYKALYAKTAPIRAYGEGLTFLERYYPPALNCVPAFLRGQVQREIERYCAPMTPDDINLMQHWDISGLTELPDYQAAQAELVALFDTNKTIPAAKTG